MVIFARACVGLFIGIIGEMIVAKNSKLMEQDRKVLHDKLFRSLAKKADPLHIDRHHAAENTSMSDADEGDVSTQRPLYEDIWNILRLESPILLL